MTIRNCDYLDHNIDDHDKYDMVIYHDKDNCDYLNHDVDARNKDNLAVILVDHDKDKGAQDIDQADKKGIDHGTMKSSSRVRVDKGEGAPGLLHLGSFSSYYRQHHSCFSPVFPRQYSMKKSFCLLPDQSQELDFCTKSFSSGKF